MPVKIPTRDAARQALAASRASSCRAGGFRACLLEPRFVTGLVLILAMAGCLYLSLASGLPKFSRAEVFFAECAREMIAADNMVTPLYHGRPFFDKPILSYWLIAGSFKLLGPSHLAARLPSVLAALLAILVTALAGLALYGRKAALFAAMALASSFMYLAFAASCMSDMLLVLFDSLSVSLIFAGIMSQRWRSLLWFLASLSVGLAFLTKGPVGLVLPAALAVIYLSMTGRLALVRPKHLILAAVAVFLVAGPWFAAAWDTNGNASMYYFFVRENLIRFAGSTYDTHRPIWFMLQSLLVGFAPWSIFLPFALFSFLGKHKDSSRFSEHPAELYLWLWIAVVTLFFSLSRGKIDYYMLPAFPAAAILVGLYLDCWLSMPKRPLVRLGWAIAVALIASGPPAALFLYQLIGQGQSGTAGWLALPAVLLVTGFVMLTCLTGRLYHQAYSLAFIATALSATVFAHAVLPVLANMRPIGEYAGIINAAGSQARVGIYSGLNKWVDEITFQTAREPRLIANAASLDRFLSRPGAAFAIVPEHIFAALPAGEADRFSVMKRRRTIMHSLNPGFAFARAGRLKEAEPVLLVTNLKLSARSPGTVAGVYIHSRVSAPPAMTLTPSGDHLLAGSR